MAESVHEQLVAALQTDLSDIVGDGGANYFYTPDRVLRQPAFHGGCLDPSLTTIYVLSPGAVDDVLAHSTIGIRAALTVDVAIATRFQAGTEDPFNEPTPSRWTVQTRLEHDAKKRIRADYKLGRPDLGCFVEIQHTEYVAHQTYLDGWALVFMRLVVHYIYTDTAP